MDCEDPPDMGNGVSTCVLINHDDHTRVKFNTSMVCG